jgi:hypothetical protein
MLIHSRLVSSFVQSWGGVDEQDDCRSHHHFFVSLGAVYDDTPFIAAFIG